MVRFLCLLAAVFVLISWVAASLWDFLFVLLMCWAAYRLGVDFAYWLCSCGWLLYGLFALWLWRLKLLIVL